MSVRLPFSSKSTSFASGNGDRDALVSVVELESSVETGSNLKVCAQHSHSMEFPPQSPGSIIRPYLPTAP